MWRWIALWVASLVVVAGVTSAFAAAQGPSQALPPYATQAPAPDARVLSGQDLGFRVDSISRTGQPVGTFVVRVKGQWVPVGLTADVRPAH
jgi:hypothetical protein